jgi:cellulose synthase/poly-beta-1,6-N-acetylglucosamine synthase-like glycosyltransferase
VQVRRETREGYKAGALQHGARSASGEFIAIFDADFVPQSDFLRRTVPYFTDPGIAFIQTRWGHVNREFSVLTVLQSLAIDAHFMVEQFARFRAGYWFNFNGTAGIWRRKALDDAGGWTADTLTEDLDLSYRAFLRGWRALYLRDVVVPAELPVAFSAYRRQQHRWARGSLECAMKLLPEIWTGDVPFRQKIQATLHLTGYGVHFLLFALSILYPFVLVLSERYPNLISLFGFALIFNLTAFAPLLFFVVAQQQIGRNWLRLLPVILFTSAVGAGLMLNTVRAGLQIFSGTQGVFLRTPKLGVIEYQRDWTKRLYQVGLDRIVGAELALAALNLVTVVLAVSLGNWSIAFYGLLFVIGLMFASRLSIGQAFSIRRSQRRSHS